MLLQNQLCAIILAFFAVYVIWSNPTSLTWKFHLGTLKSNFHPGWGKGHLSPLSLCLGCILKVIAKGPAAYHLQTGSEHKSRDPLLWTKSNFAVVRSLGKARRVQRSPPKPIRRQLPGTLSAPGSRRRGTAGTTGTAGHSAARRAPPSLSCSPGHPAGEGWKGGGTGGHWAPERQRAENNGILPLLFTFLVFAEKWRVFAFHLAPPAPLCAPRGPFVGPNRPIQVTHCRQRWK